MLFYNYALYNALMNVLNHKISAVTLRIINDANWDDY